jgi:ABC-type antimicrobial peptide transport system permease subunit
VNVNWGYDDDPPRVIVGIVADARYAGAAEDPEPAAYLPNAQFAANAVYVTMRLAEGTTSAVQQARSVLRELDATLAMTSISRIEEAIARDRASTQFYMTLLTIFSVLSLTLAAVGLYTVVAYAVGQRTREIGIRIALGSGRTGVTLLVAREGAVPVLSGLALGLVFSGAAKTVIQSLLVGVDRSDVSAAAAAVVVLVAVCATATLLPALRAARLHPSVALRAE